jgi:hypothetical protein
MKLELIATGEVFDVPRGLASALLVIGDGKIREPLPPAPRVLNPKSHFSIAENLNSEGVPFTIHAKCDNCKNVASCSGPTAHKTMRYQHCGTVETVPAEIAQRYARLVARSEESREQERPRRAPGSVSWV